MLLFCVYSIDIYRYGSLNLCRPTCYYWLDGYISPMSGCQPRWRCFWVWLELEILLSSDRCPRSVTKWQRMGDSSLDSMLASGPRCLLLTGGSIMLIKPIWYLVMASCKPVRLTDICEIVSTLIKLKLMVPLGNNWHLTFSRHLIRLKINNQHSEVSSH